jgi:hypothetical protein
VWPFEWTLGLEAANEDGDVIVAAEASIELGGGTVVPDDGEEGVSYEFIEFNVLPGTVLVRLLDEDSLAIDVAAAGSDSESPVIELVVTPMDGLEAKVGLVVDTHQDDRLNAYYWDTVNPLLIDLQPDDASELNLDNLFDALTVANGGVDPDEWIIGNYNTIAASLQVEYVLSLGEEDSVTVTAGTIFDTAYSNHVFIGTEKLDDADAPTVIYVEEEQGAKVAYDFALDDIDFADPDDVEKLRKDLLAGKVYGYATLPLGVQVDVAMAGISATAAFQARLVNGWDVANPSKGTLDLSLIEDGLDPLADADYEVGQPQAYAMPMYASVDVAYEMDMSGMTIAPSADFQFSSDFYKIGDNDDGDAVEYKGDVSAAQFLGRQMSASVGVDVDGIADMIDVSLSAALGFGFGGGSYIWPWLGAYNAVAWPGDILGAVDDINKLIEDLEELQKDADPIVEANADTFNNIIFVDDFNVMEISVGVEATPIDNLTLSNDFTYTSDGMGVTGANDIEDPTLMAWAAETGLWLDMIENATSVEYGIAVAGDVAATLYADVTYTKWNFAGEEGTFAKGWDGDQGIYRVWDSEQSTKAELDYEVGVKVTVDF